MHDSHSVRRRVSVLLVSSVALLWAAPAAAQIPEANPIRIFLFCADESSDETIDVNIPAGEWQVEPMTWSPEGNTYTFSPSQGRNAVEQLARQLERTKERQQLMLIVESREQAEMFLEVVATEVEGTIRGGGIFAGGGSTAPSSVTTSARQPVLLARLTVRNLVYTTDFLGTRVDALRTPAVVAASQIERWVEVNFQTLRQSMAGIP